MEPTNRIFVYKMATDNGGAPCVQSGWLSLAICKPKIRCKAKPGDWIIGLGGKHLGPGIVYIAQVKEIVGTEYYRQRAFSVRHDCIYHFRAGELTRKRSALYHEDPANSAHDVGTKPNYSNAQIVLSDQFRYFGKQREPLPVHLQTFADSIGRGHRVNHSTATHDALIALVESLLQKHEGRMQIGQQHTAPDPIKCCSRDEGTAECHRETGSCN